MSVLLAAGAPGRGPTGVSVVPMIQKAPHGMTKSTDFSVLVMKPALGADALARDDEVDALAGVDVEGGVAADQLLDLVGPHAGGVDHDLGADLELDLVLEVAAR